MPNPNASRVAARVFTLKVNPGDLGKFEARLGAGLRQAIYEAQSFAAHYTVALMRQHTRSAPSPEKGWKGAEGAFGGGAVWRERLLNGWFLQKKGLEITVKNRMHYTRWVAAGRRPGLRMPPVDDASAQSLQKWVRDKLHPENKADLHRKVWLVAKAIQRRGLRARPFYDLPDLGRVHAKHAKAIRQFVNIAYERAQR